MAADNWPAVRRASVDRPWEWLAKGWRDFMKHPGIGLLYGLLIVAVGYVLIFTAWQFERQYYVLPLAAGFMLVAPILAVGLYEISRRIEAGQPVSLGAAIGAFKRNPDQIAYLGFVLMFCHLVWVRVATLLFALFFENAMPSAEGLIQLLLTSRNALPFLAVGTAIGFAFACVVFALAAVSIPMLLDRDTHALAAAITSLRTVRENWKPMALWAALIAIFTAIGIATALIGLAVTMPLIGHATWHAYRDLVERS
jgi:uncharacterized membrane protein